LDGGQLSEVMRLLTEVIDTAAESVYTFRRCATCWETVGVVREATVDVEPYYEVVL
jgi:hypothetical protein